MKENGLKVTYLGPVQPIVVPKPPLSFKTTSLSNSFLVSAGSSQERSYKSLLTKYHMNRSVSGLYNRLVEF